VGNKVARVLMSSKDAPQKMIHVTYMNESYHIWMSHVPCEWVMSHIVARVLMSSKDAPQKMQLLGTIKKLVSLFPWRHNAKRRETPTVRLSSNQNRSESQYSCIFQEPLNRGRYDYKGSFVRDGLRKSCHVSKIPPVQAKNQIIIVSVFLSTLQLTALLLKSFRLRLHCYTVLYIKVPC